MNNTPRSELLEALAVTAELVGFPVSDAAAAVMALDLAQFPPAQVIAALRRCRFELKGRLTTGAILDRLDDGRPGPEEAWAMVLRLCNERLSAVTTTEVTEASGPARSLVLEGDRIAARMAFREAYAALVTRNRSAGIAPRWDVTLGYDIAGRLDALAEAVTRQQLDAGTALRMAPPERLGELALRLGVQRELGYSPAEILAAADANRPLEPLASAVPSVGQLAARR